jgi:phosphatidylglycerophosphate synthase
MNPRRVLIVADESADWIVAGLRQLDRVALSLDEFAVANNAPGPIEVCLFWSPDLYESQRWVPQHPRLTHLAFTTEVGAGPYDLVLSTRLFLYRKALSSLVESRAIPVVEELSWENCVNSAAALSARAGLWENIRSQAEVQGVEARFLRGSGKSQDGFVSRYLNRPLSRALTKFLLGFDMSPNAWTWLIFPIPVIASLVLARGSYWSFVSGLILFQVFSVLDGCDGEIARAKFMESERGRQLDDLFDVLSNILLVLGLGFGLSRQASFYGIEGIVAGILIAINEWYLATRATLPLKETIPDPLGGTIYPRHRNLRSSLSVFGEEFASLAMQMTKRDVAVLFFVVLAVIGFPALILHLLLLVTAVTLAIALTRAL